ncbi:hypothetical protein LCGC14_0797910 [marine sediment metagenome]|uniref:Uncharacterized protein n=1 Tax=marine sediment metagenome TaxID=412755 RepID=A0A0F9PQH2_9ZZZZ
MPEVNFGDIGKSLDEIAEKSKKDEKKVKKISTKEAIEKSKAYAEEIKEAIKERNEREYDELDAAWNESTKIEGKPRIQKIEIDSNKVYLKLRDMNEKDYPIYDTIIRRAKSGRKHSYLESYINFINRYFKELVRDDE